MLSVIILTKGDERGVVMTLAALVPGAAAGLVRDVLLIDREGGGAIERVADVAGCQLLVHQGTDGALLREGARAARSNWLLFLRAGAVLEGSWIDEIAQFMESAALAPKARAAVFRYARSPHADLRVRDAFKTAHRLLLGPSADQGLLIARAHYDALGGHAASSERAEAKLLAQLRRKDRILLRSRIVAGN
ncbi:glycosyl transferase [Bradyrhizobium sp. LHD-71]|uniref:glycosyl transferase n=1 Tax=Bradyrhizobium sp. LHD-71 TaxID=3072141 RepID=UPI00280CA85B|nr:glycosyl transferase [Bradyrhizobium sp. LHD-71]MDQ8730770.1 glycosyl transferase [Bradyrhizobium sp. LHD-71]